MLPSEYMQYTPVNTYLRNSLAVQSKHNATQWLVTVLDIKVDLSNNNNQQKTSHNTPRTQKTYFTGDLRSPWLLGLLAVDQGHSKHEDEEEREKNTPELHDALGALKTRD